MGSFTTSHQRPLLPKDLVGALKRLDDAEIDSLLVSPVTGFG